MKSMRILIAATIAVLGATVIAQATAAEPVPDSNPNDAAYWALRTEHPAVCYKHDPPTEANPHGRLSDDGTSVILNPYQPSWPGDHWELLVVKSGSVDSGNGPGNAVYHHPVAGVAYAGPLNGGGEQGVVSHWIVCKGTTPDQPVPTAVVWIATNGDCDAPSGTLAISYDVTKVDYVGDAPGSYPADTTVTGQFTPKSGSVITGSAGPFSHTFEVDGAPCEEPGQAPPPQFVDPTCADRGAALVDPNLDDDITYEVVEGTVGPGQGVTVRAVAGAGIVLTGPTEWSHTFGEVDDADCVVAGTPSSAVQADCGAATLTFTNTVGQLPTGYTAAAVDIAYTVDGEVVTVTVQPGATEVVEIDFPEDSGIHTIVVADGDPVIVESDCELAPTIDVSAFSPVCQADTPYIEYEIDVTGSEADTATLTFIDDTGAEILTLTGVPLAGSLIYPGAAGDPANDWPGWRLNAAGLWVPDPTDAHWRDGLTVRVVVASIPAATAAVAYPPAASACAGPEIVQSGAPTTTAAPTTTVVASGAVTTTTTATTVPTTLPRTGATGTAPLMGLGAALIALGLVLAAAVRRPRPA